VKKSIIAFAMLLALFVTSDRASAATVVSSHSLSHPNLLVEVQSLTARQAAAQEVSDANMKMAARACKPGEKPRDCRDEFSDCQNGLNKKFGIGGKDIEAQGARAGSCMFY
jgi:hypothetical protein